MDVSYNGVQEIFQENKVKGKVEEKQTNNLRQKRK